MFAKPKTRDSVTDKSKIQSGNSPQRQTFRKTHMANSVRFTDFTQAAGGLDSPNLFPMYQSLTNPNSEKRIDKLEERLSILASQYDQFIPLLGLLDQANNINKADATIKKIQKKQIENDEKITQFSQSIQTLQKNVDVIKYQYLSVTSQTDVQKQPIQQMKREKSQSSNGNQESEQNFNLILKNQTRIEGDFNNIIRDLREEINNKLTTHSKYLEDFKQIFNHEQANIQQTISHLSANQQNLINSGRFGGNGQQQFVGDQTKQIEERIEVQLHILREQIEKEFINLWREIGVVSVHHQLNLDQRRKERVHNQLVLPDNLDKFERQLKINNVEQGVLLDEMDQFNKENCQRLVNELRNLEDRINIKQERLQLFRNRLDDVEIENTKKEIEMINEQFNNLKNQVDGTRKISVYELKRIEDKMEQIDNIRVKISNDPNEKKDLTRITQDIKKAISFQEKISKLVEQIDENLKIVSGFQLKIDEKLLNLHQEVYAQ